MLTSYPLAGSGSTVLDRYANELPPIASNTSIMETIVLAKGFRGDFQREKSPINGNTIAIDIAIRLNDLAIYPPIIGIMTTAGTINHMLSKKFDFFRIYNSLKLVSYTLNF